MAVTTATELQAVADVSFRLRALLDQARIVKPETSVEPPLPVSEFVDRIEEIRQAFPEDASENYRFYTVETAARDIFFSLISTNEIESPAFVEVWDLLDILLICSDAGQCTPELSCWLIEELLDSQTTHGCRVVFDYLESRRERLAQKDFHKKNLVFLRSCNELLRRLSRAEDAIFCGRVFFFLFQTFPLGDKSSVNLRGEFHTENTTKFEHADGDEMDVDPEPANNGSETPKPSTPQPPTRPGSKAVPIKAPPKKEEEIVLTSTALYPIFWRLQQDFSEPIRLFAPSAFRDFKRGLDRTITKFKKTPTVVQTQAADAGKRGTKRRHNSNAMDDAEPTDVDVLDNYNPKYLTSRDLFDLELSDLAFQRHILVQALILIDFLLSLTERAKKRLSSLESTNKSMLYSFTLTEDDSKWATSTRATITNYLSASAEGRLFNRMVETVLARDKNWIRWKVESCPSIVKGPTAIQSEIAARKGIRDWSRVRRMPDKVMGSMNMSFLDEGSGGGLGDLQDPSRFTVPPVQELLDGIKTDELDKDMAMDDSESRGLDNAIANKRWRILRQTRASQLNLLDKVEPGHDLDAAFRPHHTAPDGTDETEVDNAVEGDPDAHETPDGGLESGGVEIELSTAQHDVTPQQHVQMTAEREANDGGGDESSGDPGRPSAAKIDANQDLEVE